MTEPIWRQDRATLAARAREAIFDRIEVEEIPGGWRAHVYVVDSDGPVTYLESRRSAEEAEALALNVAVRRGWVLPA